MSTAHPTLRAIALALVVALLPASPTGAQSTGQDEALVRLALALIERDKEAAKQEKAARKQAQAAQNRGMELYKKGRRDETEQYLRERDVWGSVAESLSRERQTIQEIVTRAQYGLSRRQRMEVILTAGNQASRLQQYNAAVDSRETMARVRLDVAKYKGAAPNLIALIERELAVYPLARAALAQQQATLDRYLSVLGAASVGELQQRQQAQLAEQRRKYQERERAIRRSEEYLAALALALGLVTAIVLILKSPTSTEEDRQRARQQLNALKDAEKNRCLALGGIFFDGGDFSVGTCSK